MTRQRPLVTVISLALADLDDPSGAEPEDRRGEIQSAVRVLATPLGCREP